MVSGLPLVTKPMLTRLRLIRDAFALLAPGAPFVQFTYSVVPPIPKSLPGVSRGSLRTDLDEPSAGARLGVSQALNRRDALSRGGVRQQRDSESMSAPENPGHPRLAAHRLAQCAGLRRSPPMNSRWPAPTSPASRSPIFRCRSIDGDLQTKSGVPKHAVNLKRMMAAHHGVLIASPEYNASVTPLLKNAIDWVSRVQDAQESRGLGVFKRPRVRDRGGFARPARRRALAGGAAADPDSAAARW